MDETMKDGTTRPVPSFGPNPKSFLMYQLVFPDGMGMDAEVSVKLRSKLGFPQAGKLQRAERKFGNYIDVAFWQRGTA